MNARVMHAIVLRVEYPVMQKHDEAVGADILHEALAIRGADLVVLLEGHARCSSTVADDVSGLLSDQQ